MCVLTNSGYKTYIKEFLFCHLDHASVVELGGAVRGVKNLSMGIWDHERKLIEFYQILYIHQGCGNPMPDLSDTGNFDEAQKNKTNSTNLYPPTKGYLRETCKSQNINPIYLFSIIQIISNTCQVCFSA